MKPESPSESPDSASPYSALSRRRFIQTAGLIGVAGRALLETGEAKAAVYAATDSAAKKMAWPERSEGKRGRAGWNASRLVIGCGATLMFGPKDAQLMAAYEALRPSSLPGPYSPHSLNAPA